MQQTMQNNIPSTLLVTTFSKLYQIYALYIPNKSNKSMQLKAVKQGLYLNKTP